MISGLIVQNHDGTETVTVYGLGQLKVVDSDHPNFERIRTTLTSGQDVEDVEEFEALFDVIKAIQRSFKRLTDRVTIKGEHIYFNHEKVHDTLSEQILRYVDDGEDFAPLVNFMEKVADNPSEHSKTALYAWLNTRNFTLTPEGNFIGYKGVKRSEAHEEGPHAGVPASGFTGHAYVDDVEYGEVDESHGLIGQGAHIPYPIGALIEMPLPECVDDSRTECNRGLHVGTYEFARGYSSDCSTLTVEINPRDVVSVPAYSNASKIRVTRLRVIAEVDGPIQSPVVYDEGTATDLDEGYYNVSWSVEDVEPNPEADPEITEALGGMDEDERRDFWSDFEFTPDGDDEDEDAEEEFEATLGEPLSYARAGIFYDYLARAKKRRQPIVRYIEHMSAKEGNALKHDGEGDPKAYTSWLVQ